MLARKLGLGCMDMKVKDARKLVFTLLIVGFIISLGAYYYEPLLIVGIVIMTSSLIPHFLYNKCPHCGKNLGRNEGHYCQFCGQKFE